MTLKEQELSFSRSHLIVRKNEYHLVSPQMIREGNYIIDMEIVPEKIRDTGLQIQQLLAEFQAIKSVFNNVDNNELQKEYLKVSGRPDSLFLPEQMMKEVETQGQGQPVEQTKTGNMPSLMNTKVR